MRSFLLFALVAALALYCVSAATPEWKNCAGKNDDVTISNITSNVWPPEKGKDLILNVTGNNTKQITKGGYTINIKVGGLPLPDVDGNIDDFKALPWPVGDLQFQYKQDIPAASPSGNYHIQVSALDQDKVQIFCITLDFHLSSLQQQQGERAQSVSRPLKRLSRGGKARVNRPSRRL